MGTSRFWQGQDVEDAPRAAAWLNELEAQAYGGSVPAVTNGSALIGLNALVADAANRVVNLGFIGDSLTVGKYANGSVTEGNTTNMQSWRNHGVAAALRSMFQNSGRYGGNAGEGVVKLWSSGSQEDDRIAQSTAIVGAAPGVCQHGWTLPSGATATFTNDQNATDIDIVYYTPTPTTGFAAASYTVDGGGSVSLPLGSANTFSKVTISGLSDAAHTVVVTAGAGSFFLSHFIARRSATNGVIVHRMGRGGATVQQICGTNLSAFSQTNLFKAQFDQQNIDGLIVMIGFNDWNTQPTVTPSTFASGLQALITYVTVTLGKPVLLVPDPRSTEIGSVKSSSQADYYAQMKALASGSLVAYADPNGQMVGTYEAGNALGFYADSIHYKEIGHGLLARGIFEVLIRTQQSAAVAP